MDTLVPVLKVAEFDGQGTREVVLPPDDAPIIRPFAGDLIVLYAEDKPDHFEFISPRRLRELDLSEEELHLRAIFNLPKRPPKIELHGAPPRQMLVAGGNFEATLLLHDNLWSSVAADVPGDLLAVAPARDLLFVSNTAWDGARSFLAEVARRKLADESHMLSQCILRRTSGKWVVDDVAP